MPIEFTQYPPQENTGVSGDTLFRLTVAFGGLIPPPKRPFKLKFDEFLKKNYKI